jgi:hypothetical protein
MHKQLTFEQRHYINIARNNDKSMRTITKAKIFIKYGF